MSVVNCITCKAELQCLSGKMLELAGRRRTSTITAKVYRQNCV